jgi:hypothetical protein
MPGLSSLARFVKARIRDDENLALEARTWFADRVSAAGDQPEARERPSEAFSAFVLAHEPDHVLIDCGARRLVVDYLFGPRWAGADADRDAILGLLSLPYAGRPDYRDTWRPDSGRPTGG